jgi:hypothetical protein
MTPKEQAEKIIKEQRDFASSIEGLIFSKDFIIKCAKVKVAMIKKMCDFIFKDGSEDCMKHLKYVTNYWNEVESEIEKAAP